MNIPTNITPENAKVYVILKNMQLKMHICYVILVVFVLAFIFMVLAFIYLSAVVGGITAALEGILGPTMYLMCMHYFSADKKVKELNDSLT